jgi:hypothetical protein
LHCNNLIELPSTIIELVNLQTLTLQHNQLIKLPETLNNLATSSANWWNLQELDCSNNSIHTKEIHFILVTFQDIEYLPHGLAFLPELQAVHLDNNPLIDPPLSIATNLESLTSYLKQRAKRDIFPPPLVPQPNTRAASRRTVDFRKSFDAEDIDDFILIGAATSPHSTPPKLPNLPSPSKLRQRDSL